MPCNSHRMHGFNTTKEVALGQLVMTSRAGWTYSPWSEHLDGLVCRVWPTGNDFHNRPKTASPLRRRG